jgi:hypothetical protein
MSRTPAPFVCVIHPPDFCCARVYARSSLELIFSFFRIGLRCPHSALWLSRPAASSHQGPTDSPAYESHALACVPLARISSVQQQKPPRRIAKLLYITSLASHLFMRHYSAHISCFTFTPTSQKIKTLFKNSLTFSIRVRHRADDANTRALLVVIRGKIWKNKNAECRSHVIDDADLFCRAFATEPKGTGEEFRDTIAEYPQRFNNHGHFREMIFYFEIIITN